MSEREKERERKGGRRAGLSNSHKTVSRDRAALTYARSLSRPSTSNTSRKSLCAAGSSGGELDNRWYTDVRVRERERGPTPIGTSRPAADYHRAREV